MGVEPRESRKGIRTPEGAPQWFIGRALDYTPALLGATCQCCNARTFRYKGIHFMH